MSLFFVSRIFTRVLQVYDLRTSLLICDGSSANLAALKASHGHFTGAYNNDHSGLDPFVIKPYFINQYDPANKIHWLICPSHQVHMFTKLINVMFFVMQLKNMINALFSSQGGGTKGFRYTIDGEQFGWKAITDLYARECQRRESGEARLVPKLREAFVLRDSWTKLNVLPAKIMQVRVKFVYLCYTVSKSRIYLLAARASSFRTIQVLQARPSPI